MRCVAMLVFVVGCHSTEPQRTTPVIAHEDVVPELTCPPTSAPSKLRGVDPQQGGYLVAQSDAELERWHVAMEHGTTNVDTNVAARNVRTMWAAFDDLRPEIQHCMTAADGAHADVHYELRVGLNSNSVATLITSVSLQRIDGMDSDRTPKLATTAAEPCVRDLLARLVLPPGHLGIGESMTVVRQDFCTPTVAIAMNATRSYVDSYMTWWRAHRDRVCPTGLSDLEGYGRDQGKDPWHQPYVMRCDASGFEVISGGPDRRVGTADDLSSHR